MSYYSKLVKLIINGILLFWIFLSIQPLQAKNISGLENKYLKVKFNNRGIVDIYDKQLNKTVHILEERQFKLKIDDKIIDGSLINEVKKSEGNNSVTYLFKKEKYEVRVVYTLQKGWRFVTKQLFITVTGDSVYRVQGIVMFMGEVSNNISNEYLPEGGRYGAFLRLTDNKNKLPSYGVFFALQNPFMQWQRDDKDITIKYTPDMDWHKDYGTFKSDRAIIGTYKLSGQTFYANMIPEWQYSQQPNQTTKESPQIDYNEIKALSDCIQKFLLYKPDSSLHIEVGWTLNDYQIDVATSKGRKVYKRVIDQAAALGAHYLLYTPANSNLSSLDQNRDAWGWENVLWLGLGQKIRKGEWKPGKDPVPPIVQDMTRYASLKGIGLIAYVYPTMPWMQNPEWTSWIKGKPGGYLGVDTGIRSFQDWFINLLVEFYKETGIRGYSFDHWWMRYDQHGTTSQYAQWFGTRRILEELRKRIPDIVIDGRQQYQQMGPWTWLAGSYPHPLASDEQPQSFKAFPDLSWDRISADRQRYAAWWYRINQFAPIQIIPGYMTHQTQRFNAKGELIRKPFRIHDWDYMGWKYSVLSAIGTAPFNLVMDYIPARDTNEVKYFSDQDKQWLHYWLYWPDKHINYMRNLRPIIGQPMLGRVDGTSAIINNRGFVFLFNPNYRSMNGKFKLDQSIGLKSGDKFIIKTLYPKERGFISSPDGGFWKYGQQVNLHLEGTQARVFEIIPVGEVKNPLLLNAKGKVELKGNKIIARDVEGPMGHKRQLSFIIPKNVKISELVINGQNVAFKSQGDILTTVLKFNGKRFDHDQQLGKYDSTFTGGKFIANFEIPNRIFEQLKNRKKKWAIPYTKDDLKATWLGPSRLLLFIQIADPKDSMKVSMTINGDSVNLKRAYSSVYSNKNSTKQTFIGFYVDLTSIVKPEKKYQVTVTLPIMKPGQFQGLFFQNIKTEYTKEFSEVKEGEISFH